MPRIAAIWLVAACSFDADYGGGHYKCSDGVCPTGLVCTAGACVAQGAIDAPAGDARTFARTCSDPEPIPTAGGTFTGTTTGRQNTITASCAGSIMNGHDAVFRFDATLGDSLTISITASWAASVYAIAPCAVAPATPACLGSAAGVPGNPLALTAGFTGAHYIIVDGVNPATDGSYTLTITH